MEDVCCHSGVATWVCFQADAQCWPYPWSPDECPASLGTRSRQLILAGHGKDRCWSPSAVLGTAPMAQGARAGWQNSIPRCIPAHGVMGRQDPQGGQCQTRSSRALMAKRVIPACPQLHPQWKDPKQQCRTHVFTVLWGFPCQLCPSPGQQHPQDAAGRAGWGQTPSGATVHMCHRLDTRRTDWKPPMEPPWRYLGFLGLSSRLSGTQRGSDRSSREHSPQPRQRILPAGLPLFGALLSLRTARHRREHQGLGIVALNCLHTCKEYGISGLFHLRFLPTQPSRMLSVELKFRETRRRNWLSLALTAEDTETKKTSFGNPREMGFHTNLSHRRIFAQPCRSAAARPGTGAAGCSALRSYLGDVPARAREDQPVLG